MIGKYGDYLISADINKYTDFLSVKNFESLYVEENIGNVLPTLTLSFTQLDTKMFKYLNEGNELKLSIGTNKRNMIDMPFVISDTNFSFEDGKWNIQLNAILDALNYAYKSTISVNEGNSADIIKKVANKYFNVRTSTSSLSDTQKWHQYNISDMLYIDYIMEHSSVPLFCGITMTGDFILKDIDSITSKNDWYISNNPKNDIKHLGNNMPFTLSERILDSNIDSSYKRYLVLIDDKLKNTITSPSTLYNELSQSKLVQNKNVDSKYIENKWNINKTYSNYYTNEIENERKKALMLSTSVVTSFEDGFKAVKILDNIQVNMTKDNKQEAEEFISGNYFVTNVSRSYQNELFQTFVTLSRESKNENFGDNL